MPRLPAYVGRYEVKSRVGRGGMGEVLLAWDTNPNTARLVAIKLLSAAVTSPDLLDRFTREARALAALSHPNIVGIYDSGEHEGAPYIVMEYVRGETLAEKIERRAPMSLAQKLAAMVELCAGLAHAHDAGLIHRDVKPANLMVDSHGRLKILDFGIVRVDQSNLTLRSGSPTASMRIGTPGYMSPEQIEGLEIDPRSDIFSVGAVCHELLTFHQAFPGADTSEVELAVLKARPPDLASLVPGLDPEIRAIVTRALEKDPARRYQDAAALGQAFEGVRSRLRLSTTPERPIPTPPPGPGRGTPASRADVAYQRALAVHAEGAYRAARRYAIEALSEDANHEGARALLAQLDGDPSSVPPPSPPPQARAAAPPAAPPVPPSRPRPPGSPPPEPSAPTVLIRIPDLNRPRTPPETPPTDFSQTVVIKAPPALRPRPSSPRPTDVPAPTAPRHQVSVPEPPAVVEWPSTAERPAPQTWPGGISPVTSSREWGPAQSSSLPTVIRPVPQPPQAPQPLPTPAVSSRSQSAEALWTRHGRAVQSGALVLLGVLAVAGIAWLVIGLSDWLWPSGQLLTVTRPEGGTITGSGVNCGTNGSACSVTLAKDGTAELQVQPDAGSLFVGYTGDCAPSGRTTMAGPRTCGATFEREPTAAVTNQMLTIVPPTGGTVLGVDIKCGTLGSQCSTELPNGVPVTLSASADAGYSFGNFTGDCTPAGDTQMTAPRTCGAVFRPSLPAGAPVGPPPVARAVQVPRAPSGGGLPSGAGPPAGGGLPSVAGPPSGVELPTLTQEAPAPPPIAPDVQAKNEIARTLKAYCDAYKNLDFAAIRGVFPGVPPALADQFKDVKSMVKCTCGDTEYVELNPEAGSATLNVPWTLELDMNVGGRRKSELIAKVKMSRPELRADWRIDGITYRPK